MPFPRKRQSSHLPPPQRPNLRPSKLTMAIHFALYGPAGRA